MNACAVPILVAIAGVIMTAVGTLIGFVIFVTVIGTTVEIVAQHHEDRDRCLKQATNGYDIKQCR